MVEKKLFGIGQVEWVMRKSKVVLVVHETMRHTYYLLIHNHYLHTGDVNGIKPKFATIRASAIVASGALHN